MTEYQWYVTHRERRRRWPWFWKYRYFDVEELVEGATEPTYTVTAADAGKWLTGTVTETVSDANTREPDDVPAADYAEVELLLCPRAGCRWEITSRGLGDNRPDAYVEHYAAYVDHYQSAHLTPWPRDDSGPVDA